MSYSQELSDWLHYLESIKSDRTDHFQIAKKIARELNIDHFSCPVITIAGTNGKGSCATLLENIFSRLGYRVGCFTSPHLMRYNERIRILQKDIDDQTLCMTFRELNPILQKYSFNYFTWTTFVALWLFKKNPLDLIILEVGLGGRYDPVNIVENDIAVITSIGLDHCEILGNTRELIAKEKSGIFRRKKPIVCGETIPPDILFSQAELLQCPFYLLGRDFSYQTFENSWCWESKKNQCINLPKPFLHRGNIAVSLKILELLQNDLSNIEKEIQAVIRETKLMGRQFHINSDIQQIFDVAHNPPATQLLAEYLEKLPPINKVHAIFSIQNKKNILETARPLIPWVDEWHIARMEYPGGASAEQISIILRQLGGYHIDSHDKIANAYQAAKEKLKQSTDILLVFGSFHTVREVLFFLNMG